MSASRGRARCSSTKHTNTWSKLASGNGSAKMSACWKVTFASDAARARSRAASSEAGRDVDAGERAPGLLRASVTVWAPTPQPASSTRLPGGYRVSRVEELGRACSPGRRGARARARSSRGRSRSASRRMIAAGRAFPEDLRAPRPRRRGRPDTRRPRGGTSARRGRRARVRRDYLRAGFHRPSVAPVGSTITLNQPTPGISVTSFAIVAPSDFAFCGRSGDVVDEDVGEPRGGRPGHRVLHHPATRPLADLDHRVGGPPAIGASSSFQSNSLP